jgi:hypothetical protein
VLQSVNVDNGEAVGSVKKVQLQEIPMLDSFVWGKPINNGKCLWVEALDFDTRPRIAIHVRLIKSTS